MRLTSRLGKQPRQLRKQQGFVLLMTLALILLACLLLNGIARYSLSLATESLSARESLQRKWGSVMLARLTTSRAPELLELHMAERRRTVDSTSELSGFERMVRLGDLNFRMYIDDESRKLHLGRLYTDIGGDAVGRVVRLCAAGEPTVRLRPWGVPGQIEGGRVFDSWGQVFSLDTLPSQQNPATLLVDKTSEITCWGDGRLHYSKCSDRTMKSTLELVIGAVDAAKVMKVRAQNPTISLDDLLQRAALPWNKANRVRSWLTDHSTCHTLWMFAESGNRTVADLYVIETSRDGTARTHHFSW